MKPRTLSFSYCCFRRYCGEVNAATRLIVYRRYGSNYTKLQVRQLDRYVRIVWAFYLYACFSCWLLLTCVFTEHMYASNSRFVVRDTSRLAENGIPVHRKPYLSVQFGVTLEELISFSVPSTGRKSTGVLFF